MAHKQRFKTLAEFREETKKMSGDTVLMMIDPNDLGHFVQISNGEVHYINPEEVLEEQEDYFDDVVVVEEDNKHTLPVMVFYAAHD